MLCTGNYYCRKGACLLCFNIIQSILLQRVINIVLIYIIARYTWFGSFSDIVHWYTIYLFLILCSILNHHRIWFCSQILNMFHHDNLSTMFCCRQINPQPSNFRSSTRSCYHWNMENYWGSTDCGEGYRDLDRNGLPSVNLCKYTTVTNQYEQLPWTWTWRLMYFDRWSHFEKRPGRV